MKLDGAAPPKVAILMATFQGERFLAEQLDSIAGQTHTNWELWASDDGSSDRTISILTAYRDLWPEGKLHILKGPQQGLVSNFLSLAAQTEISADYFALSDQDDVWHNDKLQRALDWIIHLPPDKPALYCSRTIYVDTNNRTIGKSPLFARPPSLKNALVQNIAGGNTMVFNEAARKVFNQATPNHKVVLHDWWLYLGVMAASGVVYYDPKPTLRYRQHGHNYIGMGTGARARLSRLNMVWNGKHRHWNSINLDLLKQIESTHMTASDRETVRRFTLARTGSLKQRLTHLRKCGAYRQTSLGTLGLWLSAATSRL